MSDLTYFEYVPRLLTKSGAKRVKRKSVPEKIVKFFKDFVNTLLDLSWNRTLLFYTAVYFMSWTMFAVLYYLVAWAHNDFSYDPVTEMRLNDGQKPCFKGARTLTEAFLMSVESQVSTGFGEHYPTEECPEAITLLMLQHICGVFIDGCLMGTLYTKIIKPPQKQMMKKFSNNAVICLRDGKLCLIIRLADPKQQHAIKTKINVLLFETKKTLEGETIVKCPTKLKLQQSFRHLMLWPETICHVINEHSPLYDISASALSKRQLEIGISISGESCRTGQFSHASTSYLATEILWGHRFASVINYDSAQNQDFVDYSQFDVTLVVPTPRCSAKELERTNSIVNTVTMKTCIEEPEDKDYLDLDIAQDKPSTSHEIERTLLLAENYKYGDYVSHNGKFFTHFQYKKERVIRPSL